MNFYDYHMPFILYSKIKLKSIIIPAIVQHILYLYHRIHARGMQQIIGSLITNSCIGVQLLKYLESSFMSSLKFPDSIVVLVSYSDLEI